MESKDIQCPADNELMTIHTINKETIFKNEKITYPVNVYVCKKCGLEIGTIKQTAEAQCAISDAYREKVGLLTGSEIKQQREKFGLTQSSLAKKTGVGIASIKRWENGMIQSKSMNTALKAAFQGATIGNLINGNRALSTPRIKLVIKEFEKELGIPFLAENDMMLFDAKYLWYADMIAYNKLGKSLTGGTYAKLPYGPQLNNYKDLIDEIRNADEAEAEALAAEEKKIITSVAVTFPEKQMVIDASHRENIWIKKSVGSLIPYSDAACLTEILV